MEDATPGAVPTPDRSVETGSALRALREGLANRLESRDRPRSELEEKISARLLTIAEELAKEQAGELLAHYEACRQELDNTKNLLAAREVDAAKLQDQLTSVLESQKELLADAENGHKDAAFPADFEAERQALLGEKETIQLQLADQTRRTQEIEAQLADTLTDLEQALSALGSQEAEHTQEGGRIFESESQRAELEAELDELREQLEAIAANNAEEDENWQRQLREVQATADTLAQEKASLVEELERAQGASAELSEQLNAAQVEQSRLQEELSSSKKEFAELSDKVAALEAEGSSQTAALADRLAAAEQELAVEKQARETLAGEQNSLSDERDGLAQELERLQNELEQLLNQEDSESAQLKHSQLELQAELERLNQSYSALTAEHETLTAERAEHATQRDALNAERDSLREENERLLAEKNCLEGECNALAAERDSLLEEKTSLAERLAELQSAQESLAANHEQAAAECEALQQVQRTLVEERDALHAELESLSTGGEAAQAEVSGELESLRAQLAETQERISQTEQGKDSVVAEQLRLAEELANEQSRNRQAAETLQAAETRIRELSSQENAAQELEQLQKKFELALADTQKLKRQNAELQEELTRRPEPNENESAELVGLRVERDALASRVAELEAAPPTASDEDLEQQLADLQRRFELAVEDLRDYKQQNAELKQQMANSSPTCTVGSDSGPLDWQAQKARLLAELESEDSDVETTPERREQRSTIEGTIEITDRVVAEREREISELKSKLSQLEEQAQEQPTVDALHAEILDNDELIQTERAKLEKLQNEWHEKLREAELEISVQRAALARKESEIEHKMAEIVEQAKDTSPAKDDKPRRRWLSALGLRDDEEPGDS